MTIVPSPAIPGAQNLPLKIEPRIGASLRDLLQRQEATGEDVIAILRHAYITYVTEHLPVYRRLFALILEADRVPLVFHCTAGKDRTGISAALVLLALGAARDQVIDDYCATRRYLDLEWRERILAAMLGDPGQVNRRVADVMFDAHPDYIGASLAEMDERHGSPDAYLRDTLGLDASRLERLRQRYLD